MTLPKASKRIALRAAQALGDDACDAILAARTAATDDNFPRIFQTIHRITSGYDVTLCCCCLTTLATLDHPSLILDNEGFRSRGGDVEMLTVPVYVGADRDTIGGFCIERRQAGQPSAVFLICADCFEHLECTLIDCDDYLVPLSKEERKGGVR